jgi:hypothetical protein
VDVHARQVVPDFPKTVTQHSTFNPQLFLPYFTFSSSISNISVSFGPISPPAPRSP